MTANDTTYFIGERKTFNNSHENRWVNSFIFLKGSPVRRNYTQEEIKDRLELGWSPVKLKRIA